MTSVDFPLRAVELNLLGLAKRQSRAAPYFCYVEIAKMRKTAIEGVVGHFFQENRRCLE